MRSMIPSRSYNRSNSVSDGRTSIGSSRRAHKPPELVVPGAPENTATMRSSEHNSWKNFPVSNEVHHPSPSVVSLLLETEDDDEEPVPVRVNENDPSEHVVVKNGYTFYIRYVDEPISEEPLVQRNLAEEDACEVESLPSISNELSRLMDDSSMLPEGAIATLEHTETSARDWINYDELPLLLNQRKQQRPVSIDHVSLPPPGNPVFDNQHIKDYPSVMVKPTDQTSEVGFSDCDMFPPFTATPPLSSLETFSQHNEVVLMNSSRSAAEATTTTMVPDFSHYCVDCEKFFPSNDSLQQHMEFNHRLFADESLIAMATSTPQSTYTQLEGYGSGAFRWPCTTIVDSTNQCLKRAFFCDLCNISFDLVESYYTHNHSVHGGGIGTDYR